MEKDSIFIELTDLNNMLFRRLFARYKELNLNVTPMQSRIIMTIYNNECQMCQKDLEKIVLCNKSTLSSVLSTMEKNGFIERRGSLEDSRRNYIYLTESAKEIVNILESDHKDIDMTLAEGISEEEMECFRELSKKIKNNIERI